MQVRQTACLCFTRGEGTGTATNTGCAEVRRHRGVGVPGQCMRGYPGRRLRIHRRTVRGKALAVASELNQDTEAAPQQSRG